MRPLLRFVRLSSERASQAVRQDCSAAKKQEPPPALLVVVRSGRLTLDGRDVGKQAWSSSAAGSSVATAALLRSAEQWSVLGS
jgi:hypothetical protein